MTQLIKINLLIKLYKFIEEEGMAKRRSVGKFLREIGAFAVLKGVT